MKARYNWAPFYVRLGGDQPLQDLTFEVILCFSLHWWMGLDLAREPSDAFCCSNLEIGRGYHPPPTLAVSPPRTEPPATAREGLVGLVLGQSELIRRSSHILNTTTRREPAERWCCGLVGRHRHHARVVPSAAVKRPASASNLRWG